jgi:class 3 adenylate cyclase
VRALPLAEFATGAAVSEELVQRLVGRRNCVVVALSRGTASFEPIGRVELKGFAAPIALWRASRVLESA